jgi:hypothetical protein
MEELSYTTRCVNCEKLKVFRSNPKSNQSLSHEVNKVMGQAPKIMEKGRLSAEIKLRRKTCVMTLCILFYSSKFLYGMDGIIRIAYALPSLSEGKGVIQTVMDAATWSVTRKCWGGSTTRAGTAEHAPDLPTVSAN